MPRSSEPRGRLAMCGAWIAGGFSVILLLAGLALAANWIAGFRLGPPAADLTLPERTLLSIHLVIAGAELDRPAGEAEATFELQVAPGESASEVVEVIQAAAVVRIPALLRSYLRYRGLDRGVQAGAYDLRGTMTLAEVADALQSARAPEITITVPEGWRREQIADGVSSAGFAFGAADFLSQTETITSILLPEVENLSSLEGFLFPDTYRLPIDAGPQDLALAMLENFVRRVDVSLRASFQEQGLGLVEAVTLASIVEREATLAEERPLIAGVFIHRLRLGIRLESDPTVQYALGRQP
ncbi:MAG: endolytic transglycosylase MltG, partial [Anaerolineales bacterium]